MLTVTNKAAQYLRESLTRKKEGAPEALRIVLTEDGYQLTLDDLNEGDQIFEEDGQKYLLLDTDVGHALSRATIDLQDSPRGATLTLTGSDGPQPQPRPESPPEP
jgi:Fe-S cluster assembly iron-binding protein IscA